MDEPWYSARCLFVHEYAPGDVPAARVYEERIVLIRASNFDDAIRQAEAEAREYSRRPDGVRYLEHVDVFHLFDDDIVSGTELYSVLRSGAPDPETFVARFTGDFWNSSNAADTPANDELRAGGHPQ